MHLFASIVASGITLYLLRNAWERFQERRAARQLERALNPRPAPQPVDSAFLRFILWAAPAAAIAACVAAVLH